MLFDLEEYKHLERKYSDTPDWFVPEIVAFGRDPRLLEERKIIENVLEGVPIETRSNWISKILKDDTDNYIDGIWFEMRLFNWLRNLGDIDVEPIVLQNKPEFKIKIQSYEIIIEARAYWGKEERKLDRILSQVKDLLRSIKQPFFIFIDSFKLKEFLSSDLFLSRITSWLNSDPHNKNFFEYSDNSDNYLKLSASYAPSLKHVLVPIDPRKFPDFMKIKKPLKEKAQQHKNIRKAGYPYIIAIYLKDIFLRAEHVAQAWLGRYSIRKSDLIAKDIKMHFDKSGQFFFGNEIRHKTVSGTLVFKSSRNFENKCIDLDSYYIQNPFAVTKLPADLFPCKKKLVGFKQNSEGKYLEWI